MSRGFIFGKGQAASTPEELKRRRSTLEALMARGYGSPHNVGEGLTAIAQALSNRFAYNSLANEEAASTAAGAANMAKITGALGGAFGGGGGDASGAGASGASAGDPMGYRSAIADIESGGRYDAVNSNTNSKLGRAMGKYQIMEANIGPWSREALGREVTPDEFLKNPEIQDAVFDHKFGGYVQQYGPENAAQAWLGGPGSIGKTSRADANGTTVGGYGKRFMMNLSKQGRGATPPPQVAGVGVEGVGPATGPAPAPAPVQVASLDPAAGVTQALQEQGIDPNSPEGQATLQAKQAESGGASPVVQALNTRTLAPGEPGADASPMFRTPEAQRMLMAPGPIGAGGGLQPVTPPSGQAPVAPPPPQQQQLPPAAPGAMPAVDLPGEQVHDVGGAAGRTAPLSAFPDAQNVFPAAPGAPMASPGSAGVPQAGGNAGGGLDVPSLMALAADPNTPEYGRALISHLLQRQLDNNDPDKLAERELKRLQVDKARKDLGVQPKQWQKLDDHTLFDPVSGETKPVGAAGADADLFSGSSVEAQALNQLYKSGKYTKEQILNLAAGKAVTDPSTQQLKWFSPADLVGGGEPLTTTPPAGAAADGASPADAASGPRVLTDPKEDTTTRVQRKKVEVATQAIDGALTKFDELVKENGITAAPGVAKDAMDATRTDVLLQLKELYNLGVLNGPDLSLMSKMLFDPAVDPLKEGGLSAAFSQAWSAVAGDTQERSASSIANLRATVKRLTSAYQSIAPEGEKTPPPAGDVKTMTDEELRKAAGGH